MNHRSRRLVPLVIAVFVCLTQTLLLCDSAAAQRRVRMRNFPNGAVRTATGTVTNGASTPAPPSPPPEALIAVAPEGSKDEKLVAQVKERLDKEFVALNRQRTSDGKPLLTPPDPGTPRAMIDMAHYGVHHTNLGPNRFLALHLVVENSSAEALTIPRADITLKIDEETKPLVDLPDGQHFSFPYGSQFQNLQNHKQIKELTLPAQGVSGSWLVYSGLPMNSEVPPIMLTVRAGKQVLELDLAASQRALLNLDVETLGPRECLRLITIKGMLNSINVQTLVDALEQLTERKVVRYALQWSPEAVAPEQNLSHWLVQSALQMGSGRPVNDQLPSFPAQMREFHIVLPSTSGFPTLDQFGRPQVGLRLHRTTADAVCAALKSAIIALPVEELLEEIGQGHPLARAAAIRYGASKLSSSHVPFLLERTEDADPEIRVAAVRALNQFGEPEAIDALVALAKQTSHPLSGTAIESLAGSRYAIAQTRLLELIRQESGETKKQIMQVLARYPRPQWSQMIYDYVTDPKENYPIEGVRALLQVGHPKLVDVLEACLKHQDKSLRDLVFPILAQRSDARSERLATEYALAQLQLPQPPDGTVTQFLHRTKLSAAIPPLLKHLETAQDKTSLINLLSQIGDESVADAIAARYEKLQNHEKSQALNALRILRYPKFRGLAGEALLTGDGNLISQATQGLMQDGSPEACRLLIAALDKQSNNFALSHICNALGNFGGPEARAALLKARESDNPQRKNFAINALQNLYQRSPGFQYIYNAQEYLRKNKWKEAIEFYDMSLQIDPELPEALAGRGNAKLRLNQHEEAAKDIEKAYQLDPFNHLAIPGVATLRIQAGKVDEGLKIMNDGRERHQHNPVYLYNTACVYALAYDHVRQHKDFPDRETKQEEYRKKAISELQQAVTRGFADFDVAREDPDFKALKDDPEFKKLIGNPPVPAAEDAAEAAAVDDE